MSGLEPHVTEAVCASEARIVITGAGGWIGRATLDLLHAALGNRLATRVHCFGSNARTLALSTGITINQRPLSDLVALAPAPTILLHLAFLTKDRAEEMDEPAYRAANRAIDDQVLAALDPIGTRAVFVASSGAAASTNPAAAMQLYGALKREQERRFADWAAAGERRAIVTRIFNLSGPHINKQSSYALSAFILDALAGGPIRIRAPHRVIRSYVAIRELMSLVFALLLDGGKGVTRFDSGGAEVEMRAIAEAVAARVGNVAITRPPLDAATVDDYRGDGAAYAALLGHHRIPPVPFDRQVAETVEYLSFSEQDRGGDGLAKTKPA